MWNALIDAGDPGLEVLHAYTVKEDLPPPARPAHQRRPRSYLPPPLPLLRAGRRQATSPRPTGSPRPLRPGGRPCSPPSPPATATPGPRATTTWPSTSTETRSASAIPSNHQHRIPWVCTRQRRRLSAKLTALPG